MLICLLLVALLSGCDPFFTAQMTFKEPSQVETVQGNLAGAYQHPEILIPKIQKVVDFYGLEREECGAKRPFSSFKGHYIACFGPTQENYPFNLTVLLLHDKHRDGIRFLISWAFGDRETKHLAHRLLHEIAAAVEKPLGTPQDAASRIE